MKLFSTSIGHPTGLLLLIFDFRKRMKIQAFCDWAVVKTTFIVLAHENFLNDAYILFSLNNFLYDGDHEHHRTSKPQ